MPTAQPAPGSKPMPIPAGQADNAPAAGAPAQASDDGKGSASPTSPVSAEGAASAANQAEQAALAAAGTDAATKAAADAAAGIEAKPAEIAPATITDTSFSVQATGNDVYDEVGKVLHEKGFKNVNEILDQAAAGELSLANKAALVDELGEGVAALLIKNLESEMTGIKTAAGDENTRIKNYAAELFGAQPEDSEAVWKAMNNFANSTESGFSDQDRTALNDMLGKGGAQAEMALREVSGRYERSQGYSKTPALIGGNRPNTSGFTPITKADYQAEIGKTIKEFGEGSREVASLRTRRRASQDRGF